MQRPEYAPPLGAELYSRVDGVDGRVIHAYTGH
jgi:hypothetical protein